MSRLLASRVIVYTLDNSVISIPRFYTPPPIDGTFLSRRFPDEDFMLRCKVYASPVLFGVDCENRAMLEYDRDTGLVELWHHCG
jgi:hypothetical protein